MYLKILGCLFIMTSTIAIGWGKAEELKERVKRLEELKSMMLFLQGELRFHHAALSEAFENVSERIGEPLREFLRETAERLEKREGEGFEAIWDEASEKLLTKEGFRAEDGQLLDYLRGSLGYLDLALQTETLNQTIFRTDEALAAAKEEQRQKGRLYRTMGVTAGAVLTLLII